LVAFVYLSIRETVDKIGERDRYPYVGMFNIKAHLYGWEGIDIA